MFFYRMTLPAFGFGVFTLLLSGININDIEGYNDVCL